MPAAPLPPDEAFRLRELQRYEILDTAPEAAFDDIALLAATICDTPMALITFIDRERQWLKSRVGMEMAEARRDDAFCAWAIHEGRMMVVPDAPADPRFAGNPYVIGEPHIRFYAGAPIATPAGAKLGTVCALDTKPRSLSDRQLRALEALARQVTRLLEHRQRDELNAAFLEHGSSILYLKDARGRYRYVNHVLQRLLPPGADPIGRTSAELLGEAAGGPLDAADRAALGGGDPVVTTTDAYGETEWLTSRFRVKNLSGETALAAVGVDVTGMSAAERRARSAERHRREIIGTIPAVIWERRYDASGAVTGSFVSPYIRQLLGYTEDEWLSRPDFWTGVFDPNDRARLERELLSPGASPASHLCRVTAKDGRKLWAEVTIAGFAGGESDAASTRAVIVDATEAIEARLRREIDDRIYTEFSALNNELATAQRELVQQRNELRVLSEEKSRFLGMAAHDLRNPLGAILMFTDLLLRRRRGDEKETRSLEQIKTVAQTMAGIIDEFLDVSRIEAGELTLTPAAAELNDIVAGVVELQRPLAEQKQIRLDFVRSEPLALLVDRPKIEQVVTNLLSNAVKFSPPRSSVTVGVARREHVAEISVRDEGPGIDPDAVPRLFNPFARGNAAPTGGETSTGLGLVICKKIVERHGGRMRVESTPGEGATFYVELPASPTSFTAASTDSAALRPVPSAPTSRQSSG